MLDKILAAKRREVDQAFRDLPVEKMRATVCGLPPTRDFPAALTRSGLSLIAEIKPASPSRGVLAAAVDPAVWASRYEAADADVVSVLTDREFFGGELASLRVVRNACSLPVLRKDFILDERQVYQSRLAGADAVLLIAAALDDETLVRLIAAARHAGLHVLAEAHNEEEVSRLIAQGCAIIAINNRDLADFTVDLAVTERLASVVGDAVLVSASGIRSGGDSARVARAGADAVLVGEALMTADDLTSVIKDIKGVSSP